MKRSERTTNGRVRLTLALGLALTALTLLLDSAGVFRSWEHRSLDARFRSGLRPATPMSDAIVHVDIDDGAIDRIGRWPWPRALLADAIDELRRAGANTIAVDVALQDPQRPALQTDGTLVDHDALLASAIKKADVVGAVVLAGEVLPSSVWDGPGGAITLAGFLEQLSLDLGADAGDLAAKLGLRPDRVARIRSRPLEYKRAAAWLVATTDGEDGATGEAAFRAFEQRALPRRGAQDGDYAERPVLEATFRQRQAWQRLQPSLLPGASRGSYRDQAPVPPIAEAVASAGFVNVTRDLDPDGAIRSIAPVNDAPGGQALQFGLAAAARQQGLDMRAVTVTDAGITVGDVTLPLRDGRLWISWPTSSGTPRWLGLLRQTPEAADDTGHLSIRELIEMAEARRTLARNGDRLRQVAGLILDYAGLAPDDPNAPLDDQLLAALTDEIDFTLEDVGENETLAGATEPERAFRDHVHNCRLYRSLDEAIRADQQLVADSDTKLRSHVADKLAFIGWTATASSADFVPTAVGPTTPGVIVHAVLADMMLTGRGLGFLPRPLEHALVVILGLLATLAACTRSAARAIAGAAIVLTGFIATGLGLFTQADIAIPLVAPIAAATTAWLAGLTIQTVSSQRDRLRITRQFKARVSGQLVDHLVARSGSITMDGTEREITVMFTDLAGFTSLSEAWGGARTVSTLNRYMSALTDELIGHDAYVNKFLGDGVMAFWSAFDDDPEQATKACRAALACQDAVTRLNSEFGAGDGLTLRVGITTGNVIVGDCGAPPALNDYTVIGDAVNLCARLESANKQFGTRILIDGRTAELIAATGGVTLCPIGRVVVVGQTKPIEVSEVAEADCDDDLVAARRALVAACDARDEEEVRKALVTLGRWDAAAPLIATYQQSMETGTGPFDGVVHLRAK